MADSDSAPAYTVLHDYGLPMQSYLQMDEQDSEDEQLQQQQERQSSCDCDACSNAASQYDLASPCSSLSNDNDNDNDTTLTVQWYSDSDSECDCQQDLHVQQASLKYLVAVQHLLRPYLKQPKKAQLVAQSIGQAFQVAYLEFLKANGIEDPASGHDLDYQEVLNSQEMYNEELRLFTSAEHQKDVLVPKARAEPLGVVIVESGWGSVIPTVVLASMHPRGAAARCGQLNIGDQIISINGVSFVGLPLSTCQNYIKNVRTETSVKLRVISCPPVVEVLIRRPDPKYQLGFSVQNGVICSLLRGGIAERGGVRVGHRIIEIGGQSVVAVSHDKIVQKLSSAVGEIHMRTMPTTIFRLLTGQETPHYI